ncbi:MAG: diaminopimelate epimerase [Deltaproteobacteria bacterium]|nr:diaminopimelate epimerase [Deltaproteobacteria bacterium]
MKIEFQKMHGAKNDFVVFQNMENDTFLSPSQVAVICDRRVGVGADGVIVVRPSEVADFFMDYINSDGSLAEMCGNGIRCLGKYVYDNGLTKKNSLKIETRAGVKTVELLTNERDQVTRASVDMGQPIFDPIRIPVKLDNAAAPILDYPLKISNETFLCSFVSMGNPHCVIIYERDDLDDVPKRCGNIIENHPMFPAKTNVEFVKVLDRSRALMRVWERGSGETLACGTGACASAVVTIMKGLTDNEVSIELLGGTLDINWKSSNDPVVMSGTAAMVYCGYITI